MALQGDLQTISTRELLGWLAQRRASGTLSLSRDMVTWQLQLRDGSVSLASSSTEETLLGRLLIERGLLDEQQLAAILEQRGRSKARLGKMLMKAGLVTVADLEGVLAEKVERLLAETLAWDGGRFFFDDSAPAKKRPAVDASVDLAALLERTAASSEGEAVSDADILEVTEVTTPAPAPGAAGRRKRTQRIGYYEPAA